jgi:EmrB/QacA subfamily drug resistance transporter
VYVVGLAGFAIASAACGFAPNAGVLVLSRGIQGIAGAAMFATTFALLNSAYQGRDRGAAYGMWGAVSGASAAIGPIVGGLLTEHLSWRWIFFVNLPICAVALALSARALVADHGAARRRIDIGGVTAFTVAAGALTFALIRSGEEGWGSPQTIGALVLSAVAVGAFVAVERTVDQPVLDLELLRRRSFVGVLLAGLALNFGAFAYLAYLSLWLQTVLNLSPVQAGLVVVPLSVAAFVMAGLTGRRLQGIAHGWLIGGGLVVIGIGALAQAWLGPQSGWALLLPGLVVIGLGVGVATPTLSSTAMSAVPHERGGMAAGTVNTARQLGFAIGIAVLGGIFRGRVGQVLADHGIVDAGGGSGVAGAVAGGQSRGLLAATPVRGRDHLDAAIHAATAAGLDTVLLTAGGVTVLVGLVVLRLLVPRRAAEVAAAPEPVAAPA